jgi:hypothetical protein
MDKMIKKFINQAILFVEGKKTTQRPGQKAALKPTSKTGKNVKTTAMMSRKKLKSTTKSLKRRKTTPFDGKF